MIKLVAKDLQMQFNDRVLFQVPSLTFCQGDTIHLQGDNGAGKTTLMKILAGLISPTGGQIMAQGFNRVDWWRRDRLLGKALYLHQHPYLYDGTVAYNLTYALPKKQLNYAITRARIAKIVRIAKLEHLLEQNATNLSGGERQRLAIARAWIMQPKLLMLDEPTSNMDKVSQQLVYSIIEELKRHGTGLLISSHHACELTKLCDSEWQIERQTISSLPNIIEPNTLFPPVNGNLSPQPTPQEVNYAHTN